MFCVGFGKRLVVDVCCVMLVVCSLLFVVCGSMVVDCLLSVD